MFLVYIQIPREGFANRELCKFQPTISESLFKSLFHPICRGALIQSTLDHCWTQSFFFFFFESSGIIYHLLSLIPCWDCSASELMLSIWREDFQLPLCTIHYFNAKDSLGSSRNECGHQFTFLVVIRRINISQITS